MSRLMPSVELPREWAPIMATWDLPDQDALIAAFHDGAHPARDLIDGGDFADRLRAAVAGPDCSALVRYPDNVSVRAAGLVVGHVFGGDLAPCPPPLDPPLLEMPSREIAGWKKEWHTDGLPWFEPNRWTIIGVTTFNDEYRDAKTDVLPIEHIVDGWPGWEKHKEVFTGHKLNWRRQPTDAGLPPMMKPLLDQGTPRWHMKVFNTVVDEPGEVGEAFAALRDRIDEVDDGWASAVTQPGSMIVIDNRRGVHRAPRVTDPLRRQLLRIKLGGQPYGPDESQPHDTDGS